jgi:hypothetical protein
MCPYKDTNEGNSLKRAKIKVNVSTLTKSRDSHSPNSVKERYRSKDGIEARRISPELHMDNGMRNYSFATNDVFCNKQCVVVEGSNSRLSLS